MGGVPADGAWHTTSASGTFAGLELKMTCETASCIGAYDPYIFGRQFQFAVHDSTPPVRSGFNWSLVGPQTATISASDQGGGVSRTYLKVNGSNASAFAHACNVASGTGVGTNGIVANTLTPCPSSVSDTFAVDTSAPPFVHGNNSVRACADDYANIAGSIPNTSCSEAVIIPIP